MLYVVSATTKRARHATALGMFDHAGMAQLAAAMLRSDASILGEAGEISVHALPARPASCLGALHQEIRPDGLDDAAFYVDEALVRSAA